MSLFCHILIPKPPESSEWVLFLPPLPDSFLSLTLFLLHFSFLLIFYLAWGERGMRLYFSLPSVFFSSEQWRMFNRFQVLPLNVVISLVRLAFDSHCWVRWSTIFRLLRRGLVCIRLCFLNWAWTLRDAETTLSELLRLFCITRGWFHQMATPKRYGLLSYMAVVVSSVRWPWSLSSLFAVYFQLKIAFACLCIAWFSNEHQTNEPELSLQKLLRDVL